MDSIAEYLISVTGASIVCSGICCLLDKSKPAYAVVRLICGVFLLSILLHPILQLEIKLPFSLIDSVSADADNFIQQSVNEYDEEYMTHIKAQLETYIQEKLKSLNCNLKTELMLREEYPYDPTHIKLTGAISPYNRSYISDWLSTELGITAEDQTWIG